MAFKLYVKTGESLLVKKTLKEFSFVVKLYQLRGTMLVNDRANDFLLNREQLNIL